MALIRRGVSSFLVQDLDMIRFSITVIVDIRGMDVTGRLRPNHIPPIAVQASMKVHFPPSIVRAFIVTKAYLCALY